METVHSPLPAARGRLPALISLGIIGVLLALLILGLLLLVKGGGIPGREGPLPVAVDPSQELAMGLYDVPIEALPQAKAAGFDLVHVYDSRQELPAAMRYLAAAQSLGMEVIQNMPASHLEDGRDFWVQWVSSLAGFETVAWWYLPEEPRREQHDAMKALYDIVHEYDPKQRPVAVYFGTTHLEEWCDVADIILVPAYPDYYETPQADVLAWMDTARASCPGKQVVSVQALFDSRFDGTGAQPSARRVRNAAYAAAMNGSPAILWYSYSRGQELPGVWQAVQETVQALEADAPAIASPVSPQRVTARVQQGPSRTPKVEAFRYPSVRVLESKVGEERTIFALSLVEEEVTVDFEGLPSYVKEVTVAADGRTLQVVAGQFQDVLEPLAVRVYRVHREP